MEKFMRKYSFYITSLLGVIALVVLIVFWNKLSMLQKLPIMYIIALAVHEIEELKLPGGFVELVTSMTGVEIGNLGVAKFGLLCITLYATVIPAFLANLIWPVMATMLIGIVEAFAHLASARINKKRFYSPGLITAVVVQLPVAIYGFWYLFSNHMVRWYYWLIALVFLLVPTLLVHGAIIRSNGMKYSIFWKNALNKLFGRNKESR